MTENKRNTVYGGSRAQNVAPVSDFSLYNNNIHIGIRVDGVARGIGRVGEHTATITRDFCGIPPSTRIPGAKSLIAKEVTVYGDPVFRPSYPDYRICSYGGM